MVAECRRLFSNPSQLKPLLHQQPNHVAIISLPLQHYPPHHLCAFKTSHTEVSKFPMYILCSKCRMSAGLKLVETIKGLVETIKGCGIISQIVSNRKEALDFTSIICPLTILVLF